MIKYYSVIKNNSAGKMMKKRSMAVNCSKAMWKEDSIIVYSNEKHSETSVDIFYFVFSVNTFTERSILCVA